jgi:hypothetical protein
LAPADFWLFPKLKSVPKGKQFSTLRALNHLQKKLTFLVRILKTSEQWPKRWEHCKELEGGYFEKV